LLPAAVTAVMCVVLLLTQSRSAYIGTAVGVLLVLAWWLRFTPLPARLRTILLGLLLLALATAAWLGWHLVTSWVTSAEGGLNTLPTRLELWDRGLYMLRDFPFTGIGMGQFSLVLHSLYTPFLTGPETHVPHVHNVYLQLALDLGIPGALAFLLVLAACLHSTWRVATRPGDPQLALAAVGLAAGLVAFLVYGLTDAIVLGARGGLGLWIVLGLGAAVCRAASERA
jgi:putative inorganic carbon (HCO3(-)) transporter